MTMSVTAVHNTSGCFVILYVLDNHSSPRKALQHMDRSAFITTTATLLLQDLSANQISLFNRPNKGLSLSFFVSPLSICKLPTTMLYAFL